MSGNKRRKCSIKGCNYDAKYVLTEERVYGLCPKHKFLVLLSVLRWERLE